MNVNVACAVEAHRLRHFALQVVKIGHGGGRDIGNAVGHRDPGHALACAEHVAGFRPTTSVVAVRAAGGGGRALHAGIHIAFVVVANIEHVVIALEHSR